MHVVELLRRMRLENSELKRNFESVRAWSLYAKRAR
jgi:hypothetical protein